MIVQKKIDVVVLDRFSNSAAEIPSDLIVDQLCNEFDSSKPLDLILNHQWEPSNINYLQDTFVQAVAKLRDLCPQWRIFLIAHAYIETAGVNKTILKSVFDDVLFIDYYFYQHYRRSVVKNMNTIVYRWPRQQNKFLFVSGQCTKINRLRLLYKFYQNNMLDKCDWNLNMWEPVNDFFWQHVYKLLPELSKAEAEQFIKTHKRQLDQVDLKMHNGHHYYYGESYDFNIYRNTLFSVIPETGFNSNPVPFISEKTAKAIINKHPFIMASDPHSLLHLQRQGYVTFENYLAIPHYDEIQNAEERLDAIVTNTNYWLEHLVDHATDIEQRVCYNFSNMDFNYQKAYDSIEKFIKRNNLPGDVDDIVPIDSDLPSLLEIPNLEQYHANRKFCTFYNNVRDSAWPDCNSEDDYSQLPANIQKELQEIFGYVPK